MNPDSKVTCDYCGEEFDKHKEVRVHPFGTRLVGNDEITKLPNGLWRCSGCEVDAEVNRAKQERKRAGGGRG